MQLNKFFICLNSSCESCQRHLLNFTETTAGIRDIVLYTSIGFQNITFTVAEKLGNDAIIINSQRSPLNQTEILQPYRVPLQVSYRTFECSYILIDYPLLSIYVTNWIHFKMKNYVTVSGTSLNGVWLFKVFTLFG